VITPQSDARLQEAFTSLTDLPTLEPSDDLREQIWLAVSGDLPPAERRALVDRMATDAAVAEAWRVAYEMWRVLQPAHPSRVFVRGSIARHPPYRAWTRGSTRVEPHYSGWTSRVIAAAATVIVAATIGVVSLLNRTPADEFRASPGYAVTSTLPANTPLPRDQFHLRWTPAPEGSRYQLRVTSEDLQVLATASDLATPEFVVPVARLAALPGGATVFWQVDVTLPTGGRVTSPTFVARVQ
jgi:hypothetical protein